jgi:acetyl-CoA carboxylase biotin carboxylase subunit
VYFERQILAPRHVEVQVLGDGHGTVIPFVERECSIQRRHQKLIEETPSVAATPEIRSAITGAAARIARQAGYTNAGTLEFLLDAHGHFYFLEMNTRLQVEHPITELVTGVDLVHWQIRLARGERLTFAPEDVMRPRGHALECRIYAEDPDSQFMPSPGRISALTAPGGPWVRNDSGIEAPAEIPIFYDSLISKLVVWGEDRGAAIDRMRRALGEYEVVGVKTTIPFFRWMLAQPDFVDGRLDTGLVDRILAARNGEPVRPVTPEVEDIAAVAAALYHSLGDGKTQPAVTPLSNSTWVARARQEALR